MVLETEFRHNMRVEFETNWIFDKQTSCEYRIEHYKTPSVSTQSVSFVKLSRKETRNFSLIGNYTTFVTYSLSSVPYFALIYNERWAHSTMPESLLP